MIKLTKLTFEELLNKVVEYNTINNKLPTSIFMISKQQHKISNSMADRKHTFFHNHLYSEMRDITYPIESNWDDMYIIGVGSLNDVEFI